MKFNKSKLAAAIGAAALATSMQAGAVVVVGGDNGWEISFDGTINLFYNQINRDVTTSGGAGATVRGGTQDSAHLNEGLLPAFFSFNAKSPTVNGLTGTARISFAPDSSSEKTRRLDKAAGGALGVGAIDMREVVVNVDGSFGTISFGRTLGMFGRQAILKDQTLFGVGAIGGVDGGGTTLGRIGHGYVYPQFDTRFSYKTPNMNGFQVEVGLYDPLEPTAGNTGTETDTPRFEAEATYGTAVGEGNVNLWLGGLWQEDNETSAAGASDDSITHWGVDVGGQVTYAGFELVGHYYTGQALGTLLKWSGGTYTLAGGGTSGGILAGPGAACAVAAGATQCEEADNDGFYVQVGYTFNGKTKVAGSYGESNQDGEALAAATYGAGANFADISNELWTIGVYHDVNSWLKLVAEYNNQDNEAHNGATGAFIGGWETDTFSVGAFMFW